MAIKLYDDTNFIMIANAIRAKNGLETQYKPSEMATAINAFKMAKDVEPNNTSSGLNVNFKDGADGEKYNSLILNIPPLQDGTGDPSPTNKRAFKDYARFVVNYSGADTSDYETYTLNHSTLGGSIDLISGAESYFNVAMRLANYSNSLTTYTENGVTIFYLPGAYDFGDIYSESLKTVEKMSSLSEAAQNMPNNSIAGAKGEAQGSISFFIRADSFSTVSELIASIGMDDNYPTTWMETNTITSGLFTGRTELGVNNLWAIGYQVYDEQLSQDIPLEVSYKADPTLYTQGQIYETVKDLLPQDTASGAVANFPDGSDNYPVVELKANIDPIQEGTGDPSPSNVRAISGRSSCTITKTGANILGGLPFANSFENCYGYSLDTINKTFDFRRSSGGALPLKTKENTRYTLIITYSSTEDNNSCYFNYTGGQERFTLPSTNGVKTTIAVSSISGRTVTGYGVAWASSIGLITCYYEESGFFEGVVTADDFKPYSAQEKTINFGQTVYGGVLNVTTGVLTIDRAIVDLSTLTWTYQSTYTRFYTNDLASVVEPTSTLDEVSDTYCSKYKKGSSNQTSQSDYNYTIAVSTSGRINLRDTDYTNALDLTNSLSGVMFVYPVATPYDIQLTPEEVKTLLGVNNIYADSGDVEVKYRADIALYIDKIINS